MKKIYLFLLAFAFIFSFDVSAFADEGHIHDQNVKQATGIFENGSSNDQQENQSVIGLESESEHGGHDEVSSDSSDHSETDLDKDGTTTSVHSEQEENQGREHSEVGGTHSSGDTEGGHEEENGGHHEPVVETSPNYKVLGSFGAVNFAFILIGVWNKWMRRKGE